MLRALTRLKDPAVAKRVRILHVYPGFLKDALERDKTEPVLRRSLKYRLADLGNHLLEQRLFPKHAKSRLIRTLKRTEDVVQIMLEVLSGLPNVTDYYVTWCGLPSISATAVPFLSTVFQSKLRKLSLELSLENVRNLLTPSFEVQNLEELQLTIHSENIESTWERNCIMTKYLAPAISRLNATLHTLTIQSWEPADLSPMFRSITHLPALEHLVVAIPVEPMHLGDPQGLSEFLTAHRTGLRTLRLRATQYGGAGMTPDLASFDNWIRDAIHNVSLPKLRTLDISSNLFPVVTSVACLAHFSSTITSLSLTGSYRTYEDVEKAVNLVSGTIRDEPLVKLRVGLVSLSPQLIDMISIKLPRLDRLELVVRYVLPHAGDCPVFHPDAPSEGQLTSQIDDFLSKMQERNYAHWQLRHMSVLADSLPFRPQYEAIMEQTFLQCIPSMRTFR
ncbi:hypothetical protein NLJ89_g11255 [Agrocybe chaxingu]|uniref:Uncharacterized protein n=1 Tax=Agrocybe chaxingu TaxID=84603 RepID=A0A9W8JPQ1_9AGAR|nr:hypothetical protein NLJ89_g11255 [Agrocybe chaxingu]